MWSAGKIQIKAKSVALDLVLYRLRELPATETTDLRDKLREIRKDASYELPEQANLPV